MNMLNNGIADKIARIEKLKKDLVLATENNPIDIINSKDVAVLFTARQDIAEEINKLSEVHEINLSLKERSLLRYWKDCFREIQSIISDRLGL